jgi:dTMP kinase
MQGLFVTFEGGEGSGKSTQAKLLTERLRNAGHDVVLLREPGGTPFGEELREALLHGHEALTPVAELLLFLAARAELVAKVIRPALESGKAVICDRFTDSTLAYQGHGRGLDLAAIRELNSLATGGLLPNLTILLDLPVDAGRARKHADDDTFIRENSGFHERVREGYRKLAAAEPNRWFVLDADKSPQAIAEMTWKRVSLDLLL